MVVFHYAGKKLTWTKCKLCGKVPALCCCLVSVDSWVQLVLEAELGGKSTGPRIMVREDGNGLPSGVSDVV